MNGKNWLSFFIGVLSSLVLCLFLYYEYDEDAQLKDVLPSIVTGVVTLAALLFTYLNNKEQREVQLKTTIQKEWLNNIRTTVTDISTQIAYIAQMRVDAHNGTEQTMEVEKTLSMVEKYIHNVSVLALLLDRKVPLECDLLDSLMKYQRATNKIKEGRTFESIVELEGQAMVDTAHKFFASYKN